MASQKVRFAVLTRDRFTCRYCGAQPPTVLEVDHCESVANGGEDELANYATCCIDCNRGKGRANAMPPPLAAPATSAADTARVAALVEASTLPTTVAREILAEEIVQMQAIARNVRAKREISNDQLKALAAIERAIQRALETLGVVTPPAPKNPFGDLDGDEDEAPTPAAAAPTKPVPAKKTRNLDQAMGID